MIGVGTISSRESFPKVKKEAFDVDKLFMLE